MNWKTFDFNIGTEISRSSLIGFPLYRENGILDRPRMSKSLVPFSTIAGQAPPALLSAMQLKM